MDLPDETRLSWLLGATARLLERGAEPVRGLVEPTVEFFPEKLEPRPDSLIALFLRTLEHAGLGDVGVDASVVTPEGQMAGGCSTGGCGPSPAALPPSSSPLVRNGDRYAVTLPLGLMASPPLLGAHLARVVAGVFLHEADAMSVLDRREADAAIDVTATLLGFGVMITNGSHVVQKGCGGARIVRGTTLPVEETGVALAVFTTLFQADERAARRHLDPMPRQAFDEGMQWARANTVAVRLVRDDPRAIEQGAYRLRPARSWLARTLGPLVPGLGARKRPVDALDVDDEALARELARPRVARPVDAARAARLARARAIVDETLGEE